MGRDVPSRAARRGDTPAAARAPDRHEREGGKPLTRCPSSGEDFRSGQTLAQGNVGRVVAPAGFEPAISWLRTMYPGPLDDGAAPRSVGCGARTRT